MDQVNQDEQKALGIATRDLLLQIFEADDGGFMVVGGGIRLTPQNLHSLIEAVQNMVLAAHTMGLGTVIVGALDAKKAAEILGVPAGYSVVAMLPLGFPEREGNAPPRKELSEFVFYDKFGH